MDSQLGHCAVCSVDISDEIKNCSKCEAPHHRECWEYNGGRCAIYGCDNSTVIIRDIPTSSLPQNEVNFIERRSSVIVGDPEIVSSTDRSTPPPATIWSAPLVFGVTRSIMLIVALLVVVFPGVIKAIAAIVTSTYSPTSHF